VGAEADAPSGLIDGSRKVPRGSTTKPVGDSGLRAGDFFRAARSGHRRARAADRPTDRSHSGSAAPQDQKLRGLRTAQVSVPGRGGRPRRGIVPSEEEEPNAGWCAAQLSMMTCRVGRAGPGGFQHSRRCRRESPRGRVWSIVSCSVQAAVDLKMPRLAWEERGNVEAMMVVGVRARSLPEPASTQALRGWSKAVGCGIHAGSCWCCRRTSVSRRMLACSGGVEVMTPMTWPRSRPGGRPG